MESDVTTLTQAVGGELLYGNTSAHFKGVGIDSRTLAPGQLFVCIEGDRFDGHHFVQQVLDNRAGGVVVSRRESIPMETLKKHNAFAVLVPDTLQALQDLAACQRNRLPVRVVGITGTNGKSTTKEMIAGIAGVRYQTLKTQGNLNNHIGLPLSLLQLDASHEVAVLEMGMSAAGEIRRLAEIARPEIGVITNISEAHMVHLKTLKQVQAVKGELYEALSAEGTAIVNADDPAWEQMVADTKARIVTYGTSPEANIRMDVLDNALDGLLLRLDGIEQKFQLAGRFNALNLAAAYAVGRELGYSQHDLLGVLSSAPGVPGRFETFGSEDGVLGIVDYAHTPAALEEVYREVKRSFIFGSASLRCVLGACGGGRDIWKRPVLGKIAGRYCTDVIVTNEDPYEDDPGEIIEQVAKGAAGKAKKIEDRRVAIREALKKAKPYDVVVITGKGSELFMRVAKGKKIPWDDREIVREEFYKIKGYKVPSTSS